MLAAITKYIKAIYELPGSGHRLPPWEAAQTSGGSIKDAMYTAIAKLKGAKSSDPSGLTNSCLKKIGKGAFSVLHDILHKNEQGPVVYPEQWSNSRGFLLCKKEEIEQN